MTVLGWGFSQGATRVSTSGSHQAGLHQRHAGLGHRPGLSPFWQPHSESSLEWHMDCFPAVCKSLFLYFPVVCPPCLGRCGRGAISPEAVRSAQGQRPDSGCWPVSPGCENRKDP